ncbi:MAG: type II secretion system ATPase GspE [Deltaproteobacteria bacterium]|nr:type II secretion system ATPase GspE [Deltaproteobacteria bacterium]MBW2305977.1 type II secretion system ATPase GspE [Deltaproteobacteria bacterium]
MIYRPIGEILTEKFGLTPQQLDEGLAIQERSGGLIGQVLLQQGFITEETLCHALSHQLGIPVMLPLEEQAIDPSLVRKIPIGFTRKNRIVPVCFDDGFVIVAIENPFNTQSLDDLSVLMERPVRRVLSTGSEILRAINRMFDQSVDTAEQMIQNMEEEDSGRLIHELEETEDLVEATDDAPIIRLLNLILFQAVKEKASDIHIEAFQDEIQVRYRIDGILYPRLSPPKRYQSAIISRVKIMANMNIAEKRLPQDGRIRRRIADRDVDIRVSTVPTQFGERVVMRLLDRSSVLLSLEDLGLSEINLQRINRLIRLAHGILLVTGPTGSGKTTTLYAALSKINSPDKNIITIEDPIEYQLQGIGQIQVNPKIGLTFANGLRSIVRQDPDVILVGEIRDLETSEIAIQAALTGHLVFSTLHTNDAATAVTRLVDMGIEPFLVSSSVDALLAQRLIRVICQNCREPYKPSEELLAEIGISPLRASEEKLFRGRGCPACLGTGYRGRTGIYELMVMTDHIRAMIMRNADSNEIKQEAIKEGMVTLREDGVRKFLDGITSVEEVIRVTQE